MVPVRGHWRPPPLEVTTLSEDALLDTIGEVERSLAWAAAVRSELIAEYASRVVTEPTSMAEDREMEWHREALAAVCRTSSYEAHVRCDTALALRDRLPAAADALRRGSLPWAQAVALARESQELDPVTSAVVERVVLADPRAVSVSQVARATRAAVQQLRPADADDQARTALERRSLQFWAPADGLVTVHGELPVDAAAQLAAALEPHTARAGPDDHRTADQRRADALIALATGDHPHRARVQLLVHTDPVLGLSAGQIDGEPVAPNTTRRLTCDAEITTHLIDPTGRVHPTHPTDPTGRIHPARQVDLGGRVGPGDEQRRTPDTAVRRRLHIRDQHCRFPGCPTRATRCHAHHIRHWADGGPTTDDNLILLCSRHHHTAHEGGWHLTGPADDPTWTDPGGRRYHRPPATAQLPPWPHDPPLLWHPDPPRPHPGESRRSLRTEQHPTAARPPDDSPPF